MQYRVCILFLVFQFQKGKHLANDINGIGIIVDVFMAFGDTVKPNPNICNYTWICSKFKNIHTATKGYNVIASTIENGIGY